jgi:hypothetical protein
MRQTHAAWISGNRGGGVDSGRLLAMHPAMAADRSRSDPGPGNPALDAQNPDSMWPPGTDSKSLVPTFKYPFSFANKRVYEGGWSREVTVRELPVSKSMAGVNMRLTAGGVRELHWHTAGEWAIMLYGMRGSRRLMQDGKSFVAGREAKRSVVFPQRESRIRSRASGRTARNSCWCSTMEIFRRPRRCC